MTYNDIEIICKKYNIENYKINDDMTVDVDGNVNLFGKSLTELPLFFGKVTGDFHCYFNELTTLKGCPRYVDNDFSCSFNFLTNLDYCPKYVGGGFYCSTNTFKTRQKMIVVSNSVQGYCLWKF